MLLTAPYLILASRSLLFIASVATHVRFHTFTGSRRSKIYSYPSLIKFDFHKLDIKAHRKTAIDILFKRRGGEDYHQSINNV